MPKRTKPKKPGAKPREFYTLQPWQCRIDKNRAEILAYVEGHDWQTVLTAKPTSGASAEDMAAYVTAIINQHRTQQDVLQEAMKALECCLEEGITFASEMEADHAIANIKRVIS